MTLEQVQEWVIEGSGAGQELGSNAGTEEGWSSSQKLPSGRFREGNNHFRANVKYKLTGNKWRLQAVNSLISRL